MRYANQIMAAVNDQFYFRLPANEIPLSDLLVEDHLFYPVPANWHVIVTDIKDSTLAVRDGFHENVNYVAAGSIVTVLNLAYKANIIVPFFFGGDGATFIVPPSVIDRAMHALWLYQESARNSFNLELRAGTVPVQKIYDNGHELKICKFKSSEILSIPIILGNGLSYAEKIIKGKDYQFFPEEMESIALDLTGMECRWDKIAPPEMENEVVTLLAISGAGFNQAEALKKVIDCIDAIYGPQQKRQPISVSKLRQKSTFTRIELELRTKIRRFWALGFLQVSLSYFLAYVYFQTQKGKSYLDRLVKMSDTLVIDGRINTVITGTETQRTLLNQALSSLEQTGEIVYGLYVSRESIMSCYVRDLKDGHIHFVDGAEGGYTKAAGMLKLKLRK